ncbi:MAG: hypothetical protein NUV65_00585 [Candidatus Roizmanbacteria bacterium]|nr:hypothetical protein [Candidatus Roizmanbacteria bacterium]
MPIRTEGPTLGDAIRADRLAQQRRKQQAREQTSAKEQQWRELSTQARDLIGMPLSSWAQEAMSLGLYSQSPVDVFVPEQEHTPNRAIVIARWGVRRRTDTQNYVLIDNPTFFESIFSTLPMCGPVRHPQVLSGHQIRAELQREAGIYTATLQAGRYAVHLPRHASIDWTLTADQLKGLYNSENTEFSEQV